MGERYIKPEVSDDHHAHSHDHHNHHHNHGEFNRAFAIGIVLNLVFVGIEAFYGFKINSLALLADAGHNLSDVVGLVLAWGGALAVSLRPDYRHTYGWKRGTILAAFANSLILLLAMGSLVWEAVGRLGSPEPVHAVTMMAVAGVGIIINTVTALLFMRGSKTDLNIRGAFLHMAADALVSVGVVVAGALALYFGWNWLDPAASLLIALVILVGTWSLFKESLHLMFDGVPDTIDLAEVRAYLQSLTGVNQVHDLHVWAMGTSQTALSAHLIMPDGSLGDAFLEEVADALHDRFGIEHPTIQIETRKLGPSCDYLGCGHASDDHHD
jgi:cobalt-zinc-cadmium efflux system protein